MIVVYICGFCLFVVVVVAVAVDFEDNYMLPSEI